MYNVYQCIYVYHCRITLQMTVIYFSINAEMDVIKRQLSEKEVANARTHAAKLQSSLADKGQLKAGQEGRNRGFSDQIARLKRELDSDMFRDAKQTCHHQQIECHAGAQAAKDLDMYIIAFERAIMRFHADKMQEINTTLRSLWVQVYRLHSGDVRLRASAQLSLQIVENSLL